MYFEVCCVCVGETSCLCKSRTYNKDCTGMQFVDTDVVSKRRQARPGFDRAETGQNPNTRRA